jgi:hypothetical protein
VVESVTLDWGESTDFSTDDYVQFSQTNALLKLGTA